MNGCPVALQQGRNTYQHDEVLKCLLSDIQLFSYSDAVVYADIDGYRASDTPLATIPPSIVPRPYHPDIVIYNEQQRKIQLLKLTCSFNTIEHSQATCERKSSKPEYQLLISELDRLGYGTLYLTIEIGCLGHFLTELCKLQLNNLLQLASLS